MPDDAGQTRAVLYTKHDLLAEGRRFRRTRRLTLFAERPAELVHEQRRSSYRRVRPHDGTETCEDERAGVHRASVTSGMPYSTPTKK